ncbi:MAG: hypothetical protein AAGA01_15895 [Cyanobacteria bacterium P01_E01_bin.43]
MNSSDLSSIREQLLALQNESAEAASLPAQESPPPSPSTSLPEEDTGDWQAAGQSEMLQALRQRSQSPVESRSPEAVATASPISPSINAYLRRLQADAETINDLYRQQQIAIHKFQRTVTGLDFALLKQSHQGQIRLGQFCEIQDAALTKVLQDEAGRYILTAVDLDLDTDQRQASQTAAAVRQRGQTPHAVPETNLDWRTLVETPLALFERGWQKLTTTLADQSQLTPLDVLVWCGGGLISRRALELALSVVPGLWPWLVGITMAAVALGLYRWLFAPRRDGVFMARLFLALVGLAIGGQL